MKRLPLLTAFIAVLLFSCKDNGVEGLPVPKDALLVVHVNTSSLTSKLSWKEIKETDWFKEMSSKQHDSLAQQIFADPETSGVDVKSDFVYFMKKQGRGGYMAVEGKLKDAAAFEAMLKKMHSGATTEKDGDLRFMKGEDNAVIAWTDNKFYGIVDAPFFAQMNPMGMPRGNEGAHNSFPTDSLKQFAKDLVGLKSDNSIEKDDRFNDMMKESGDVHFWVNSEQYTSSLGGGMLSMMKMNTLFQGNAAAMTLNFDQGKISVKSKQYLGEEMQKIFDKSESKNVSAAVINRIPSQNVIGVVAMNVDPAGIREFLKAAGLDGMVNGFLGQVNYSLDELLTATKGEFIFAVTDLQMQQKAITVPKEYEQYMDKDQMRNMTTTRPDMKILFATSVNNRTSFEKLINIAKEKMGPATSGVNFKLGDQWFVAGNNTEYNDQFLAGGDHKVPFADKISGHPFGAFVDLQKIFQSTSTVMKTAADSAEYNINTKMWRDVTATGGEYKKGMITSSIEINLVDQSVNSLKQLNQYGNQMSAARKLRVPKLDAHSDSTTVFTPPAEGKEKTNQ
jgi:hypothetical protein